MSCVLLSLVGLTQVAGQIDPVVTLPGSPPSSIDDLTHLHTATVSGATSGGEDVVMDYYVDSEKNLLYYVFTSGDGTSNDPHWGMSNTLAHPNLSRGRREDINSIGFLINTPN